MTSLSKARKDVIDNPKEAKEADVDRLMLGFDTLDASPPSLDALSPEGQRLIQNVKDAAATMRLTIMEKNADDMIKDLTWRVSDAGNALKTPDNADKLDGSARELTLLQLRTLLILVANSEVHKFLGDCSTRGLNLGSDKTPALEVRLPYVAGARLDIYSGGAEEFADNAGDEGERKFLGEVGGLSDARDKFRGLKEGARASKMGDMEDEGMDQATHLKQARDEGDEEIVMKENEAVWGKYDITYVIDAPVHDARRDQDLRHSYSEPSEYAEKPGDPRARDDKYKEHLDYLFESAGNWSGGMKGDLINHWFAEDWARLTRYLLFNNEGSLKLKPELWNAIHKVIQAPLIGQVGYIPIPHRLRRRSPLRLEQIQADMRDVAFYDRKKTGLPRMKGSGIADTTIELVSPTYDPPPVSKVHHIHAKVDSLEFAIRELKHDLLSTRHSDGALVSMWDREFPGSPVLPVVDYPTSLTTVHTKANRNETKQDETESGIEAIDTKSPQTAFYHSKEDETPAAQIMSRCIHQLPSARTMAPSSFSDHSSEVSWMPELLNGAVRPTRRVCAESMGEVSIAHPGSSCDMYIYQGDAETEGVPQCPNNTLSRRPSSRCDTVTNVTVIAK
ncbi:hypothetical protein HYPSUDRAFT_202735 [Hypholoma sublateritium FD-334 SS-4]|uniref:HAM1-like N-terminal domain-containing protein n=1 Tax=Hypholoma sublateritium (strain FD-334 SS-4) TaxID=945553 RepID=A0A0D2L4R4_HYPSF|nr:hypothetical protein HYPSUDRAFT_202735 [Hypholoma sublateritium FD-334 SS-4]